MNDIIYKVFTLSEELEKSCLDVFAELFSSPLKVQLSSGKTQLLELDKSEEPILLNNDGVPVAIVKLINGNGAKIRFDKNLPCLSDISYKENRFLIDEGEFIILIKAARAGLPVDSVKFEELFKYPFKAARRDTGEVKTIIIESLLLFDVENIPFALVETPNNHHLSIRFDVDPPVFCHFVKKEGISIEDKSEFIRLVEYSRGNTVPK